MKYRFVAMAAAFSMGGPATAVEWELLDNFPTPEKCERALSEPRPTDPESSRAAEEILSWLSFDHPILRDILARSGDINLAFDLLFLSSGYHLPPPTWIGPGRVNRPFEHWLRTLSPRRISTTLNSSKRFDEFEVAHLLGEGWKSTYAMRGQFVPNQTLMRRHRIWSVLEESIWLLRRILDPGNHVPTDSGLIGVAFQRPFLMNRLVAYRYPNLDVHLKAAFTPYEIETLRAMHDSLEKALVRTALVHLLDERFAGLAAEHRAMCRKLAFCNDPRKFEKAYREVKGLPAAPRANGSERLSPSRPKPFDPTEVTEFLKTRSLDDGATVEPGWSFALMSDLNRATGFLAQALLHFETWRSDRFVRETWVEELRPSMESVRRLRFDLSQRSREIETARADFEVGTGVILRLADWVTRTNAAVLEASADTERLDRLDSREQARFRSLLTMLPPLTFMVERAVNAVEMRDESMSEQLAAASNLLVLVADLAEDRLRTLRAHESLHDSEKYRAIRDALAEMSKRSEERTKEETPR